MKKFLILLFSTIIISVQAQSDESSNLNYGMRLFNDKIYDVAVTQFRYFLERYPSSVSAPKVQYHLAESYIALGDRESALKNYQRLILEYPKSEFTETAIFKSAELFDTMGEKEKSARYYLQLKNYFPNSGRIPESYLKAIEIFYSLNMTEEIKENAAMLKKNSPSSPFTNRSQLILAAVYEKEDQTALAERTFSEVFRSSAGDLRLKAGMEYASFLLRKNDIAAARAVMKDTFSSASRKDGSYFELLEFYTGLLLRSGGHDEVLKIAAAEKNVEEGNRKMLITARSDAHYLKGDMEAAAAGYSEALQISKDLSTVLKRSHALAAGGRNGTAAEETAAYINSGDTGGEDAGLIPSALLFAAENFIKADRHGEALASLKKYSALFPDAPEAPRVNFMAGRAYYDSGNYQQAFEQLKKHQELYPSSEYADDALFMSAESALRSGEWRKALDQYVYLVNYYGASEFYGMANTRIEFLNEYKIREDNLNDKLADLSSRAVFESDRTRLASDWARFYFYDLKNYVKAGELAAVYYGLAGSGNADREIRFIEAASALRIENAADEKVSAAYNALKQILTDGSAQKHLRSRSAREMIKNCGRIFGASELDAQLDGIMGAVSKENLDDADNSLAHAYILQKKNSAAPSDVITSIERLYTNKKDASTYDEAMLIKAELLRKTGDNERSKNIYSEYVSKNPGTRPRFISLSALLDYPAIPADEKLRYLLAADAEFSYVWPKSAVAERRAEIYLASGQNERALSEYLSLHREARKGSVFGAAASGSKDHSAEIANIYFNLAEYSKAEYFYLNALTGAGAEQDRASVMSKLSEIYRLTGNKAALEENLKAVSAASGGERGYEASIALADLEFGKSNYTKAVTMYQDILKKFKPEDRRPVESKIIVAQFTKKSITEGDNLLADFRKKYKDGYDKNVYEPEFYLAKANGFLALKEYDKALKSYRGLLKDYPNSSRVPKAMYGEAIVLYNTGKKDEAFAIWEKIAKDYSEDEIAVETNYHLGAVYNNREEYDKAITAFQSIIKFKKEHELKKNSYKNIIDLYTRLGFNDASAKMIREYISLYPGEDDVFQKRIEIGNIYQRNGEYDTALDYFKRLIYEAKGDDEAACQFFIAETYMMMKNFRQAITEFMKVRYMIRTNSPFEWGLTAMYNTALCYEELTEYDKALEILNEIVKNHPSDSYGRQAKKVVERIEGKKNIER